MKSVEGRSVDNSRLVADEHTLCIVEGINDHGSGIAQANLEDRLAISTPPAFTYGSMVVTELVRCPTIGRAPGISGMPLILGISVDVDHYLQFSRYIDDM